MKRLRSVPSTERAASKRRAALAVAAAAVADASPTLFSLGDNLVHATIKCRPSERNRSPYVGDVTLSCGRVAIAHMPSMDMGGKCVAGVECLLRPAIDKASGQPVGADAIGGKYGTPKCEFILQLIRVAEPENAHVLSGGCWVGAHPSLGEKAASALFARSELVEALGGGAIDKVQREVKGVAGTDMRTDFLLTHEGGKQTVVEVKTVVDTDYDPALPLDRFPKKKCVFLGRGDPYARAAIFPWGNSNQKGPDGEKVVSARAIRHVRELTSIASGAKRADGARLGACVLFLVVRDDACTFRPNREACPSFARYLGEAHAAGVHVLARRVRWQVGEGEAHAVDDGPLEVELAA